ncbi:unnamed protein product [Ascophyllum nodosum]
MSASREDVEVLVPPGKHYPWYSLQPLVQAATWASSPGTYFKNLVKENDGAPVFKCHPGIASIAFTDHSTAEWFFNQPETVLDRQDGPYFGPLKCSREYLNGSLPALVTNIPEKHSAVRAYTLKILQQRLGSTQTAISHASDKFYSNLWTNGLGEYTGVYECFLQQSYAFMLEWMLAAGEEGGQELPPFKDFLNVNPIDISVLLNLEVDRPVANLAASAAQLFAGVSREQKASIEVLLESIRSSKMFPKFVEMQKDFNIDITNIENSFMFNTGFQSSAALAKNMEYCVGSLSANRDFLEELRAELDGQEINLRTVGDVEKFPLLDSFHWEILRIFPAPPFFFKEAKKDLVIPTNSGKKYQIKKGEMLHCYHPLVQIDPAAFGPDAKEFKPKRFVGNPDLKNKVFAYAFPKPSDPSPKDGMPWGCAVHTLGVLDAILKVFYARWVQEADWEMTEPAIIDHVEYLGVVGPEGMSFAKVTPRK